MRSMVSGNDIRRALGECLKLEKVPEANLAGIGFDSLAAVWFVEIMRVEHDATVDAWDVLKCRTLSELVALCQDAQDGSGV